jgi:V-type H+-transporting ATPase subunit d
MAYTPTGEIMSEILNFEADRRAINITINSFGTELNKEQRRKLYPEMGKLYPEGMLMLSRADDLEGVGLAVSGVGDYKRFFDEVGYNQGGAGAGNMSGGMGNESKSLEDMFYLKEMELSKLVFTQQFTHAVIYAWSYILTSGSGNTEHYVDRRVHRAEPEGEDRELHQCLLVFLPSMVRCMQNSTAFGRTGAVFLGSAAS